MSADAVLIAAWQAEERQPFAGWDFSHLDGRMLEDQAPWSYSTRAAELLRAARSALDLGTGGGERLLKLRAAWPGRLVATEDYPPNIFLSNQRLAPGGASVVAAHLGRVIPLPFASSQFDLVLNRHSGYNSRDLARILAPGGTFFTQQVDGRWASDLQAAFGARPKWPDAILDNALPWLEQAGLEIVTAREWAGKLTFTDVGAIVYYLRAVPWMVAGFSVASHLDGLLALQARLERGEPLSFWAGKYLLEARKPA